MFIRTPGWTPSRLTAIAVLTAMLCAASALWPPGRYIAQAAAITVDSSGDGADATPGDGNCATATGACTLRAAIQEINASGAASIAFRDAYIIQPQSPLDVATNSISMDGTTSGSVVTLDGQFAGGTADGLVLSDGLNTVRGMVIVRFAGSGIVLNGTDGESVIAGNFIGTDTADGATLGNGAGITINGSPKNTIGGTGAGDQNVISGNSGSGIVIQNAADGNALLANLIGTKGTGAAALGNGAYGVTVINSSKTLIGTPLGVNVISGNALSGILLSQGGGGTHDGTRVQDNKIGTNILGTAAIGNGKSGILTLGILSDLLIGGAGANERNIISGNGEHGIDSRAAGTGARRIENNYIGVGADGSTDLGNVLSGVYSEGNNLTIGGTAAGTGNVISGNSVHGVIVVTRDIRIFGNIIGLAADGATAVANGQNGVLLSSTQAPSQIGSATGSGRNVISGNTGHGISLISAGAPGFPANATIDNNYIGTDATGTLDRGNGGNGIQITTSDGSLIGSSTAGRNVISGNGLSGVRITDSSGNTVAVNYIGTNAAGTGGLGNDQSGVTLDRGSGNTVGSGNGLSVISGNSNAGVSVLDTTGNTVRNAFIGTNAAGDAAIANDYGVSLDGSSTNTIGGAGTGNLISGNTTQGIALGSDGNVVAGNLIGLGADGSTPIANGIGVKALGKNHTIGGPNANDGNVISGNTSHGVWLSGATGVTMQYNFIGTAINGTTPRPNGGNGVVINNGASANVIGASAAPGALNIIANNTGDGIRIDGAPTVGNAIRINQISASGGRGIENINGGNTELAAPVVVSGGAAGASGTSSCAICTVRVYSDAADEGRVYGGATTTDGAGAWTFSGALAGPNVNATVEDTAGNTSEFSTADTDGDGCSDAEENGTDPKAGGDRDPKEPWDFFDVNGNRIIDLTDTLAILEHFGQKPGDPGYDDTYNRIAPNAAKPWRTALAGGGFIDLLDALLNLDSFGHNCAGPP